MPHQRVPEAGSSLDRLFRQGTLTGVSDAQLLARFVADRDELAFEALVARYGTVIWNVCHGVLVDPNDADDAMQATLLVLARKAHSIRSGELLSGWLCRVAYRVSVRAGVLLARRRHLESRSLRDMPAMTERLANGPIGRDEIAALFEEIDRLPDRYRIPVVLCHLEGLTAEAAAARLGCPAGTVWGRLSRARARLRQRLLVRGVTLSAGLLAGELIVKPARGAISEATLHRFVAAATQFAKLDALASITASTHVATLTVETLRAMVKSQMKTAAAVLMAIGVIAGVGTGVLARLQKGSPEKIQPAKPIAELKNASTPGKPAPRERLLQFPSTRALGIIYVQDGDELDFRPLQNTDSWRRLGEARGVVRLPAQGMVRLDLSQSSLADLSPLAELAPDAIQALRLHNLGAKDDALRHVGHLTGLKEINLSGNFITDAGLAPLENLKQLQSVSLGDSLIGDDGIQHIAGLPSIRGLYCYRARITDRALRLVGKMKTLTSLDLGVTAITDRGIAELKDLENIGWLRFSETNTTDASLAVIGGLTELVALEFDKTRATDAGLAHLAGLKKLKYVRAFENRFTDAGLAHLAKLPAIEILELGNGTRFTDAGLEALAAARALKSLNLSYGSKFSNKGLWQVAKLPALESLRLTSSNNTVTESGIVFLGRIKTLQRLHLEGCALGKGGLKALNGLPALKSLLVSDTALTFGDLAEVENFIRLEDLQLFRMSPNPGRPTLRSFRNLKNLTFLQLPSKPGSHGPRNGIDFEPAEFTHLSGLTKLETLEYSGLITDAGVKHLAPLSRMKYLALRNADLTDEGLKALSAMKSLDFLVIGGRITDRGLRHLEALTSLRFLSLDTKLVSLEGIRELKSKLPSLHTVQPFDGLDPLFRGPEITYSRVGEIAPDFRVTTRSGQRFSLADQRGKVVLVQFWGSASAPCIRALPKLKELQAELSARGDQFAMISVTSAMAEAQWRAFLDEHDMDWPQALLTSEYINIWDCFHVRCVPDYVVIDRDGKIVADGESTDCDISLLRTAVLKALR
jgi:RNA polymerase sigma factor (sigma-70 family)